MAEGQEGAPGVRTFLLAAPNLVFALSAEIQSGANAVDREIAAYLESQGRKVERLGLLEGRQLWKEAVEEARAAAGSAAGASAIFVRRLAEGRDFDAFVMPSLFMHQTRMDFGNASWYGVSRRMKVPNAPSADVGGQSTLAKGVAYGGVSGPAWVASLHVLVFARDGQRVLEGRGGIDFLHEVDLGVSSFRFQPNSSLFLDRARLREGVERAFAPYLVPPEA